MNFTIIFYIFVVGYITNIIILFNSTSLRYNYVRTSTYPKAFYVYCLFISIFWIFILPIYINNHFKFFYNTPIGRTILKMKLKKDIKNLLEYQKMFKFGSEEYFLFEELDKTFKKLTHDE